MGFPGGTGKNTGSGQESSCQCRRHRFDPWVGKIPWRRAWQPTAGFLPGKSHGQRSLVGHSLWGRRVEHISAHTHDVNLQLRKWKADTLSKVVQHAVC